MRNYFFYCINGGDSIIPLRGGITWQIVWVNNLAIIVSIVS